MKRIFFILFSLVMVSSCLDDGSGMTQSYTHTADFQYAQIQFSADSTFFNSQTPDGFGYDVLNFYHKLNGPKTGVDGGFILSCLEMPKSGNTEGLNNRYRCYLPNLSKPFSNIYTVYHQNSEAALMPAHSIMFPHKNIGTCKLEGCFITNTVEVAEAVKANFKDGDRLTLKATGYLDGQKTGSAEINLADFSAQKDSIVSSWTPFELEGLKNFEYVDFEIISTNPAIPAYFCMDNVIYTAELNY